MKTVLKTISATCEASCENKSQKLFFSEFPEFSFYFYLKTSDIVFEWQNIFFKVSYYLHYYFLFDFVTLLTILHYCHNTFFSTAD